MEGGLFGKSKTTDKERVFSKKKIKKGIHSAASNDLGMQREC